MKDIDYTRKSIFTKKSQFRQIVPLTPLEPTHITTTGNTMSITYNSRRRRTTRVTERKPVADVKSFALKPKKQVSKSSSDPFKLEEDYGKICLRCGCHLGGTNVLLLDTENIQELCLNCQQHLEKNATHPRVTMLISGNEWRAPILARVSYLDDNILPRLPAYFKKKVSDTFATSNSVAHFVDKIHRDYVYWVNSIRASEHMNIIRRN